MKTDLHTRLTDAEISVDRYADPRNPVGDWIDDPSAVGVVKTTLSLHGDRRHEWGDGSAVVVDHHGGMWDFGVHRDRLAEAQEVLEADAVAAHGEQPWDALSVLHVWVDSEFCLRAGAIDWYDSVAQD